jgi:hypothetical protein
MSELPSSNRPPASRHYIGEWYGRDFASLSPAIRSEWATTPPTLAPCPFKAGQPFMANQNCSKEGGVCSLRLYAKDAGGAVTGQVKRDTVCPHRFLENGEIFAWIGEYILNDKNASIIPEVPFLTPTQKNSGLTGNRAIGKIDHVLVSQKTGAFEWCAVEIQAVYFSGENMQQDFARHSDTSTGLVWPNLVRRPDYRSSGPKRLMPQLQTKVPSISRWGKKTAVVIDEAFWNSLGKMNEVEHLSNAEVVWFVVKYSTTDTGKITLVRHTVHHTTLDGAVLGLTGGTPMPKDRFESELHSRLQLLSAKTNLAQ